MASHANAQLILTSKMWIFEKINNIFWHLTSKQYIKTRSLNSEDFALEVLF